MNAINHVLKKMMILMSLPMLSGMIPAAQAAWQTIHNDFYWYDQNGNTIQTRSGCLRKFNDAYYWYGGTNGFKDQTCYTSTDLVHWTYKGIVLSCPTDANRIDVLFNDLTKQYVMILKYNGNGAHLGIATCLTPDGKFTFKSESLVDSALIGDMSVYEDADSKAYLAAVSWKTGTNAQHGIWLMSPDYLTVERRIFLWNRGGREAPMIFKRSGIYYYATSATNWTVSTATEYYSAQSLAGPWSAMTSMSMPGTTNSWDSQCDFVSHIKGAKDSVYMYCGDRWEKPDPRREGDYVWLPMTFNGAVPVVNYYQDWEINLDAGTWRPFDYLRNLAMRKTATASSVNGANSANNVTDSATYLNYTNTRWESAASDPQWIMVDLGSAKSINRVILKWHENYGKSFKIQASVDALTWSDVYSTTKGVARSVTDVTFGKTSARYVRMYGTQRGTANGYSLFDFMVLNDSLDSPVKIGTPESGKDPVFSSSASLTVAGNGMISYFLPNATFTKLDVFNMSGKLVATLKEGYKCAGSHEAALSGRIGRGLYLFRLIAGKEILSAMKFVL
jgi:hypothetical protein